MSLRSDIWNLEDLTKYSGGGIVNVFSPSGISMISQGVRIEGTQDGTTYTSGQITTVGKWSFLYGFMEVRAKIPTGKGLWSSFFTVGENWPPEIDVFENIGDNNFYLTVHGGINLNAQRVVTRSGMSDAYHDYAVDWQPEQLIWYIDRQKVFRTTQYVPQVPQYLYLMLRVGGDWPGNPDGTTTFPADYDIDYIRVWKRK